jgi:hypothetical protein
VHIVPVAFGLWALTRAVAAEPGGAWSGAWDEVSLALGLAEEGFVLVEQDQGAFVRGAAGQVALALPEGAGHAARVEQIYVAVARLSRPDSPPLGLAQPPAEVRLPVVSVASASAVTTVPGRASAPPDAEGPLVLAAPAVPETPPVVAATPVLAVLVPATPPVVQGASPAAAATEALAPGAAAVATLPPGTPRRWRPRVLVAAGADSSSAAFAALQAGAARGALRASLRLSGGYDPDQGPRHLVTQGTLSERRMDLAAVAEWAGPVVLGLHAGGSERWYRTSGQPSAVAGVPVVGAAIAAEIRMEPAPGLAIRPEVRWSHDLAATYVGATDDPAEQLASERVELGLGVAWVPR